MPYVGRLKVLAYNIEKLDYQLKDNPYTYSGYVEVDLVDTSAKQLNKIQQKLRSVASNQYALYNQRVTLNYWAAIVSFLTTRMRWTRRHVVAGLIGLLGCSVATKEQ